MTTPQDFCGTGRWTSKKLQPGSRLGKITHERNRRLTASRALCNPPYVPSDPEELARGGIYASFAGGKDGREIIDKFLERIASSTRELILLLEGRNRPLEVARSMQQCGYSATRIGRRAAPGELLTVWRFVRLQ